MSRYSNCFACLTIMLVCASSSSSSSSQPTYRSIETFLRGTRPALLLQLCLSCVHDHISVSRSCLRTPWQRCSAICSPHHQNAPQQRSSLPLLALATPDTKWRTVAITTILGKLRSSTGFAPAPFQLILHPVPLNMHSDDLSLIHAFQGFHQLFNQAFPC